MYAISAQGLPPCRGVKDVKIYVTPEAVVPGYRHRSQSEKVSISVRGASILHEAGFTFKPSPVQINVSNSHEYTTLRVGRHLRHSLESLISHTLPKNLVKPRPTADGDICE